MAENETKPHEQIESKPGEHHINLVEPSHYTFIEKLSGGRGARYTRVAMAALSSIPWVGGFMAAAATLSSERDQGKISELQKLWLEEHKEKVQELGATLNEIFASSTAWGPRFRSESSPLSIWHS